MCVCVCVFVGVGMRVCVCARARVCVGVFGVLGVGQRARERYIFISYRIMQERMSKA